jgi:signal recognition particle subunit SRP72
MKQRASFIVAQSKKKGGNMSMGVGMTQGSNSHAPTTGSGGGGGNNKKKKGKK